MNEIGGYLELEGYNGKEYYEDFIRLNTGRNGILFAILARGYQKVYIPRYICDSVIGVLRNAEIGYEYYSLDHALRPVLEGQVEIDSCLLFVNYFGQFTNKQICELQRKYGNILVDNTQAFFQVPVQGIDTVYTCRKYFGVPDGAYLSASGVSCANLERDISFDRMRHILGRFESCASEYYADFQQNERRLDTLPVRGMSTLTQNFLKSIDYERVKSIRRENFYTLHERLAAFNQMEIFNEGGLFMYPLLISEGADAKIKLIKNRIYVPTLWPNVLDSVDKTSKEYDLADNLVLLPIDQRYRKEDMLHVCKVIERTIETKG